MLSSMPAAASIPGCGMTRGASSGMRKTLRPLATALTTSWGCMITRCAIMTRIHSTHTRILANLGDPHTPDFSLYQFTLDATLEIMRKMLMLEAIAQ